MTLLSDAAGPIHPGGTAFAAGDLLGHVVDQAALVEFPQVALPLGVGPAVPDDLVAARSDALADLRMIFVQERVDVVRGGWASSTARTDRTGARCPPGYRNRARSNCAAAVVPPSWQGPSRCLGDRHRPRYSWSRRRRVAFHRATSSLCGRRSSNIRNDCAWAGSASNILHASKVMNYSCVLFKNGTRRLIHISRWV